MNKEKIKDLLYEGLSDDLKPYYEKSDCCSLIVKFKKDKAEKQQKIEELENINDKISSALNSAEKEIDRLNNLNKQLGKENKRLNNIINELEKTLREGSFDVYFCSTNTQKTFKSNEIIIKSLILDKLKELKENK